MKKIIQRFKTLLQTIKTHHCYRLISIDENSNGIYLAKIQIINKNLTFDMRPEDILSDDAMTDRFSQRDIRTLTYLGYLGINTPKYTILAQQLSEKNNQSCFAIKERGKQKPLIKTATEISQDTDFVAKLNQKDAHLIGYVTAMESVANDEQQKLQLILEHNN